MARFGRQVLPRLTKIVANIHLLLSRRVGSFAMCTRAPRLLGEVDEYFAEHDASTEEPEWTYWLCYK